MSSEHSAAIEEQNVGNNAMETLMGMGYSRASTVEALQLTGNDMEQAVGYLLLNPDAREAFAADEEPSEEDLAAMMAAASGDSELSSDVKEIMAMGYTKLQATHALSVAYGDTNQAVQYLLMGESRRGFDISSLADPAVVTAVEESRAPPLAVQAYENPQFVPRMVASRSSLESMPGGAPALNYCILVAVDKFYHGGVVNAEYFDSILKEGMQLYTKSLAAPSSANGDASTAPTETILEAIAKVGQKTKLAVEETKKGTFSHEDKHNRQSDIRQAIVDCRNEQEGREWSLHVAVLQDKTALVVCLPPKGSAKKFWMMDLFPRSFFRVPGAYARVHRDMAQLIDSVVTVWENEAMSSTDRIPFSLFSIVRV